MKILIIYSESSHQDAFMAYLHVVVNLQFAPYFNNQFSLQILDDEASVSDNAKPRAPTESVVNFSEVHVPPHEEKRYRPITFTTLKRH